MSYSSTRAIEVPFIVATVLWVSVACAFAATAAFGRHVGLMGSMFGLSATIILTGIAACATTRVMLADHYRAIQGAFDFGRELGRQEGVPLQRVH